MVTRDEARSKLARRRRTKAWSWPVLAAVLAAGIIYPVVGFVMLICMGAAVLIAPWRGRLWCDVCPRGAFYDLVIKRLGIDRPIPKFVRTPAFRVFMMAVMMAVLGLQLSRAWGDWPGMGGAFVTLLVVTTVIGLAFAAAFNPRSWCSFCPMGSMAHFFGRGRYPMSVSAEACTDCGKCSRHCPMELDPSAYKQEGSMAHGDCLKCLACVAECPRSALSFDDERSAA